MFFDEYDEYEAERYFDENCILERKKQALIKQGIAPERIREDGTYVMTKEEFIEKATKDLEERRKQKLEDKIFSKKKKNTDDKSELKEQINKAKKVENDYRGYMSKLFEKRRKRRR